MANRILTAQQLTPGKKYKFIGTSGEYDLNKLVAENLFSLDNNHTIAFYNNSRASFGISTDAGRWTFDPSTLQNIEIENDDSTIAFTGETYSPIVEYSYLTIAGYNNMQKNQQLWIQNVGTPANQGELFDSPLYVNDMTNYIEVETNPMLFEPTFQVNSYLGRCHIRVILPYEIPTTYSENVFFPYSIYTDNEDVGGTLDVYAGGEELHSLNSNEVFRGFNDISVEDFTPTNFTRTFDLSNPTVDIRNYYTRVFTVDPGSMSTTFNWEFNDDISYDDNGSGEQPESGYGTYNDGDEYRCDLNFPYPNAGKTIMKYSIKTTTSSQISFGFTVSDLTGEQEDTAERIRVYVIGTDGSRFDIQPNTRYIWNKQGSNLLRGIEIEVFDFISDGYIEFYNNPTGFNYGGYIYETN